MRKIHFKSQKYMIWKLKYCRLHIMNIMCKDWYSKLYFLTAKNSMKGMPNDGNANIEKFYFSLAIWSRRKPELHQNHICIIHV